MTETRRLKNVVIFVQTIWYSLFGKIVDTNNIDLVAV